MRSLIRTGPLVFLVAVAAVLVLPSAVLAGGDSPWAFEARATYLNPVSDDGSYASAINPEFTGTLDMLKSVVPELAVSYRATDRFAIEVSALMANMDLELDRDTAGELSFGDSDLTMFSLTGLYDVATWGDSSLWLGLSVAYADFDPLDITDDAVTEGLASGVQLNSASLDTATLFGFVARLDTPLGSNGWYFSSSLRYLVGGPDVLALGTPIDGGGEGSKLSAGAETVFSGTLDFDPLIVSLGVGFRY